VDANPKRQMQFLKRTLKTPVGKLLFSVALGLLLAWLFFRASGGNSGLMVVGGAAPAAPALSAVPETLQTTDYVPGAGFQIPGYGSGPGSLGGAESFTADCLGHGNVDEDSAPFYQVACLEEPKWNLPRDARLFHQARYPCGVPGQCNAASCHKHHPMDTIYQHPNEGIDLKQVRN
jgi:hypothetical protein